MERAFDTIMQRAVYARDVAKSNIDEPFRYECLCCGEEVHIAAKDGKKKSPHFRHLRGNSDTDCELYLGSMGIDGAIAAARKRAHERAEIFYNIDQKIFTISICFPKERIDEFEQKGCILEIFSGQGKAKKESIRISRVNFSPDNPVEFPLEYMGNECSLVIKGANIQANYEILKPVDFPTFFKIKTSNTCIQKAKRHTDGIIYTDTAYYVISEKRNLIENFSRYRNDISINAIDEINTAGGVIWGAHIIIHSVLSHLSNVMTYFGYILKKPENVSVLWPPTYKVDDMSCCSSSKVILYSSFRLQAKSNISCEPQNIEQKNNYYIIDVSEPVKICYENIEIELAHCNDFTEQSMEETIYHVPYVDVTENSEHYIFDENGVNKLPAGRFYLRKTAKIICYRQNYPIKVYLPRTQKQSNPVGVLRDILQYYKVSEPFMETMLSGYQLSKLAKTYIENCRISGEINCKVLEYIKAGIL